MAMHYIKQAFKNIPGPAWEDFIHWPNIVGNLYIAGLAQDCSNSSASALELLQSCTKQ